MERNWIQIQVDCFTEWINFYLSKRNASITSILIDLADAYNGAQRTIALHMPTLDASGHVTTQERKLDVSIPKGIKAGQNLRLSGQGGPGVGQGAVLATLGGHTDE